jgi:release factor glutamine methyltransferase
MLTYNAAFYELKNDLQRLYEEREAAAIAHEVMEHVTGLDKMKRLVEKDVTFTEEQQQLYNEASSSLLTGMPLQYVLGHAWFMGRQFRVDSNVLIPRPETEELVQWIVDDQGNKNISILDIGTGSGCIPVSLKMELPESIVTTCDISEEAIEVARKNARLLGADLEFLRGDFLSHIFRRQLPHYDVIVSNPPYIPIAEKETLDKNVRDFEPELALFVPDEDALLFYRHIAQFGKEHLNENGTVYCELHIEYAIATGELFKDQGYTDVTVRKDMHGNLRMLKAKK